MLSADLLFTCYGLIKKMKGVCLWHAGQVRKCIVHTT